MITNKGIRVQEVSDCFLCDAKGAPLYQEIYDRLFDSPGVWSLFSCPQCKLVWLNPCPIPEDMGKVYNTYYTHSEAARPVLASLRKKVRYALLASTFGYEGIISGQISKALWVSLGIMFPPLREMANSSIMWLDGRRKGKLLDVGCGNGRFLASMRELGWDVLGVETDGKASEAAWHQYNIRVLVGSLLKLDLPANSFEAITMNHIIEHVHDPIGFFKECHRLLKPGGRLVAVTPNVESLTHKIFQESWRGLEPPRHLQLFSLRALRTCAKHADLRIKKLYTTARCARWMWETSKLIRRDGRLPCGLLKDLGWSLRLKGMTFQLLERGLLLFRKNIGEEIVLLASKE